MTFLHFNLLLAGLACVAIPIIIHLLMHRRRKPVMWGAMRFLLEAYRRQRRRMMLEKWLLLACRCLVLALLAGALGRPLIGSLLAPRGGRVLFILLDNSLSSGLKGADGRTALERHKNAAKAALSAMREARGGNGESDRAALITLAGPAEGVVNPPSSDFGALSTLIDELEPADSRADLAGAVRLVAERLSQAAGDRSPGALDPARSYVLVLSEFREGSLEPGAGGPAGNAGEVRLPVGVTVLSSEPAPDGGQANVTIAGVEPLRSVVVVQDGAGGASDGELVRILLKRSGASLGAGVTTISTRLAVTSGAGEAGAGSNGLNAVNRTTVRWSAGEETASATAMLPRLNVQGGRAGMQAAVVVAGIDEDPLPGDNRWRRPIEIRNSLRVGVLAPTRFADQVAADRLDPGSWARLALSPGGDGSGIEVVEIEPAAIDAARLAGLDAVVLPRPDLVQDSGWARLGLFVSSGGVVMVIAPPLAAGTPHLWTDAMVKGLGLVSDFVIGREAVAVEGSRLTLVPTPTGADTGPATAGGDLLTLVEGEMGELLQPVTVRRVLPLESAGAEARGRVLLKSETGPTVLWAGRPGTPGSGEDRRNDRGLVIYLGVALDLEWSDLPAKPLMVPLMQEIVRQGVGQARGTFAGVAGSRPAVPARAVELRPLVEMDAKQKTGERASVGVDASGATTQPVRTAGLYSAVDERGTALGVVVVNPDARAGRINAQSREVVGGVMAGWTSQSEDASAAAKAVTWLPADGASDLASANGPGLKQSLAAMFGTEQSGRAFDWPLLVAALVLAVVEVFLARWASHAEVLPASVRAAAGTLTGGRLGSSGNEAA